MDKLHDLELQLEQEKQKRMLLEEELEVAQRQAAVAMEAKRRFISNISHELRTPLNAIIGFSEGLLSSGELSGPNVSIMARVVQNGRSLLQLLSDIIDLTKLESEQLSVQKETIAFDHFLSHIIEFAEQQCREFGLAFVYQYSYPLPLTIESDSSRLKQVLYNLFANAAKFSRKGGTVSFRVEWLADSSQLKFSVNDSGQGIPADKQDFLFKLFSQIDNSTTRLHGGSGIGLFLCKRLTLLMGGDIGFTSQLDSGSTFYFTIHPGNINNDQLVSAETFLGYLGAESGEVKFKGRLLVAEDNEVNQELIRWVLTNAEVSFDMVSNGLLAFESTLRKQYDLILMDIQMPVMDGVEAVKSIRASGITTPIIAVTANVLRDEIEHYFQVGFDGYVAKPFESATLYREMGRFLSVVGEDVLAKNPPNSERFEAELPIVSREVSSMGREISSSILPEPEPDAIDEGKKKKKKLAFLSLCMNYRDELPHILQRIESLYLIGDWETLRKETHTIKGTAGSFGFSDITTAATEVDKLFKANTLEGLDVSFQRLCDKVRTPRSSFLDE